MSLEPEVTLPAALPTRWGTFRIQAFRFPDGHPDVPGGTSSPQPRQVAAEHVAILKGDVAGVALSAAPDARRGADASAHQDASSAGDSVLARVHSSCLTGDVLGSHRCDCGPQLEKALAAIEREGRGVVLYLNQEGRGIGLFHKIAAYALQDQGANTVEANEKLGFEADGRDYAHAAAMLHALGVRSVRLMTNNPSKVRALEAAGVPVVERVPHVAGVTDVNRAYLSTKRDLLGHLLSP